MINAGPLSTRMAQHLSYLMSMAHVCSEVQCTYMYMYCSSHIAGSSKFVISFFQVLELLQDDASFFPAFKQSQLYIRLLAELDLLKESVTDQDGLITDEGDSGFS